MLEKLGKYEIRLQIGRGAMGTVFEGFDPAIGRRVAIKTLRTEMFEQHQLPEVLIRFKREAQSAGRLSHPHIVTIHEYGEQDGTPYIVMEYINGKELGHELDRGVRFSHEDVVRLMTQLLGALAHAHENGVVHRDLKPANMFVLEDGSLKVVDFGIARLESSNLTETGAMLGTPAYMSPEQIMALPVDHRSDLFSAGVILYQLLTGDKPFSGSLTSVMQKVLKQEPLPPSEINPTLSPAWDAVASRAMAKKPEARYSSARQFAEAIKLAQQSDRARDIEANRKAAEAQEHARREAESRSKEEARRREESARIEIARKEQEEQAQRTVVQARRPDEIMAVKPRGSWIKPVLIGALATAFAAGIVGGFVAYQRNESTKEAAQAEAARVKDELAKQTAAAKNDLAEQQAMAAQKQQDAKRDAEQLAQAAERARQEAHEKAAIEAQKRQDEAKRNAELAARAAAAQREKAEAEERAKADKARLDAEAKAKADMAATEQAKAELAKADAVKKAKAEAEAARTAPVKREGYDGLWSGVYNCGPVLTLGAAVNRPFQVSAYMVVEKGNATFERNWVTGTQKMSGMVEKDGRLTLRGELRDDTGVWETFVIGTLSDSTFEGKGELRGRGITIRECKLSVNRN